MNYHATRSGTASQELLDAHRKRRRLMESLEGYAFVTPAVVLIGLFGIFPVFFTVFVSAHRWRIRRGDFIGTENFTDALGSIGLGLMLVGAVAMIVLASRLITRTRERRRSVRTLNAPTDVARLVLGWLGVASGITAIVLILPHIWATGDDDMLDSLRITV
ncbi:MAG: hypothetical protein ACOC2N_04960, partial [Spirochaetota bacterium]